MGFFWLDESRQLASFRNFCQWSSTYDESSEDKDWDFEWRALTWLPAYSAEEDCAGSFEVWTFVIVSFQRIRNGSYYPFFRKNKKNKSVAFLNHHFQS